MQSRHARWLIYLVLIATVATAGCRHNGFNFLKGWGYNRKDDIPNGVHTSEQLVTYLNRNSKRVQSLRCDRINVVGSLGVGILRRKSLEASLVCEQKRNFLMRVYFSGMQQAEIGSNSDQFWFYLRPTKPAVQAYCSYADLEAGRVKVMPLPFHPQWVMETLGMADFGSPHRYQVKPLRDEVHLIEQTKSPQGQDIRKIIVFRRRTANVKNGEAQVKRFILEDVATGKEICSAIIHSVYFDNRKGGGGVVPKQMELRWYDKQMGERLTLSLTLRNPKINLQDINRQLFFTRRPVRGTPSIDLARVRPRGQPTSIQRTRGN